LSTADTVEKNESPTPENPEQAHDVQHDHAHDHVEGHTHEHAAGPALNPELTRTVDVTVPAEEVEKGYKEVVKRYRKMARIPGFRAGKVPESLVRSKFADAIKQDVMESLLPQHFRAALDTQKVTPISQPQVTNLKLEEGQPLQFQAAFEVMPEINIAGYQDTKIAKEDGRLTDEEFQAELDRIRDARSTMEPVEEERMLQRGDWAQVSYSGFDKAAEGAEPKAEISADEVVIEIGGKQTLEAFTEALTGATVGQEMDVDVSYPEDFGERRLAGKTVAYHLTVKGIKRKMMPELNDEFAKELGEYDSFEDFKTKLRESLEHNKQRRAAAEGRDKLIDALVARFQFPVPETLVQQQVDARLERGLRALAMQGMSADHMRQLNFDRLRTAQRDTALQETKGALILDRIADEEKVEVPDEEVEKQLQYFAMEQREPVETLRQRLTQDGGLARIREQLRREKTGNLLYERLAS